MRPSKPYFDESLGFSCLTVLDNNSFVATVLCFSERFFERFEFPRSKLLIWAVIDSMKNYHTRAFVEFKIIYAFVYLHRF